ncbi:MAG: flagellar filament capping protein FliD [Fimbriimonadaceae bacterium]
MSLSGITFSGINSGIDTDNIVKRLAELQRAPIRRLANQQAQIKNRMAAFGQLRSLMTNLASASGQLNMATTYQSVGATSSKTDVATVTVGSGAMPGTFELEVSRLAQGHKIASTPGQNDPTSALGLSGTLTINGRGVTIADGDSLTAIAQKINGANAGVTASVLNGGAGRAFLSLSSTEVGARSRIQIADLAGSVASSLGLISGTEVEIRESIANGATSASFASRTAPVGTMLGAGALSEVVFSINSTEVRVDPSADSLDAIVSKINSAATGATAAIRSVTENGQTRYKLDISGATTPAFDDDDGFLEALGILQRGHGNQLLQAQDAAFSIDGIDMTSSSNRVTDAIAGVTINLLKANDSTPERSTITLTKDDNAIKQKIRGFADAFNAVVGFVKSQSKFDSESFTTGPLFADSLARQTEESIANLVFAKVDGLPEEFDSLVDIGFGFTNQGELSIDDAVLSNALSSNPEAVRKLFMAVGTSTSDALVYVSSSDKTQASGAGTYPVEITQVATLSSYRAEAAQLGASLIEETLFFSGNLFGSDGYTLVLPAGSTLADTISRINNDPKLKNLVTASNDGGYLKITSKIYGTSGRFAVGSNVAAGPETSGIGGGVDGIKVDGVDVAGLINGEEATGNGQFLTGKAGNLRTEGLQVQYAGTALGVVGGIRLTKGLGTLMQSLVGRFTDTISGSLPANDKELQAQIDDLDRQIRLIDERVAAQEQILRQRFAAMENAIASAQQQQARLASMMANQATRK